MLIDDSLTRAFAAAFHDQVAAHIAAHLTCSEVSALANLLSALNHHDLAATWMAAHAGGEDPCCVG